MLTYLLIAILGVSPGPVPFPADGAWKKSPVVGSSDPLGYHLGNSTWYGAPTPTTDLNGADFKPGDTHWYDRISAVDFAALGSPLAWQGSPFYPDGYGEAAHSGATGFTAANFYSLGSGSDPLDFAGDFTGVVVYSCDGLGNDPVLFSNYVDGGNGGYFLEACRSTVTSLAFSSGGSQTIAASVADTSLGLHVACFGRVGSNGYLKVNTAASATGAAGTITPGTSSPAYIGKHPNASYPFNRGPVYEVMFSTATPSDSTCGAIIKAVLSSRNAGSVIPEDAGTVTHVTFDTSANPVDSKGLAWAKQGSPTASSSTYLWPYRRTPLAQPAVKMNGGSFTTANRNAPAGHWTAAVIAKPDAVGAWGCYMAQDAAGENRHLSICAGADNKAIVYAFKTGSTYCQKQSTVPLVLDAWNVIVASYEWKTDGTSVLSINVNGTDDSRSDCAGPISTAAQAPLEIGADIVGSRPAATTIARATFWDGWAASATQRAKMVAGQIGLLATKPAGTALAFSRADVGTVCPVNEQACFLVGSGIPEIDRRGIWVGGASENGLSSSNPADWSLGTGVTVTSNSASCPLDPTQQQTRMTLVTSPDAYAGVQKTSAGGKIGRSAWFALATGDSPCDVWWANQDGNDLKTISLTATPTRAFSAFAGGTGFWNPRASTNACARWCVSGAQVAAASVPIPFRSTTAGAYSGPATTHGGVPPRTDATTWTNLALRSDDAETSPWGKSAPEIVITSNAAAAPDGAFTLEKIDNNAASVTAVVNQGITVSGAGPWTGQASVAATTGTFDQTLRAQCGVGNATGCSCTVSSGTCTAATSGTLCYASTTAGTTPVTLTVTTSCAQAPGTLYFGLEPGLYGISKGVGYFGRVQVETGATPSPYCPTGASASTCGSSGGLGKTVTNAAKYSEEINNAAGWILSDGHGTTPTASRFVIDGSPTAETRVIQVQSVTQNTAYIVSAEMRAISGTPTLRMTRNNTLTWTGATNGPILTLTPEWQRYVLPYTAAAGDTQSAIAFGGNGAGGFVPAANVVMEIRNVQHEQGTTAGRYCGPTGAASKTCFFVERDPRPLAISVTATPGQGTWNSGTAVQGLFSLGVSPANGVVNASLYGASLYSAVYDNAPTAGYVVNNGNLTASGEQTVLVVPATDGTGSRLSVGGAPLTVSSVRAGTGIWPFAASPLYLGQRGGSEPWNGWIKKWASCTSNRGCK